MHLGLQQQTKLFSEKKLNLPFRNTVNRYWLVNGQHCVILNDEQITLLYCITCFPKTYCTLYEFQLIYNLNIFHLMFTACKMKLHLIVLSQNIVIVMAGIT